MKLHWYSLRLRPVEPYSVPFEGWVLTDRSYDNGNGRMYGAVAYDRELTDNELYQYDLEAFILKREYTDLEINLIENYFNKGVA